MSKCFALLCNMQLWLGYVIDNLRFSVKAVEKHKNWHKIEWNYINVQMLNRGQGHSKKAHFSSFCSRARISTSSLGDTATVFKCFHFAFWQNEIQKWFKTCNLYRKKDQDIIWSVLTYCHPSFTSGAQMWLPNKPGSQMCQRNKNTSCFVLFTNSTRSGGKGNLDKIEKNSSFFSWVRPLDFNDYLSTCGAKIEK